MEYVIFFAGVALFLLFLLLKGIWDGRRGKQEFRERRIRDYGEAPERKIRPEEMDGIPAYFEAHKEERFFIDDITWNDLNMDRLFQEMDYTFSSAGEEYLYALLRLPQFSEDSFAEWEKKVCYLQEHPQERASLQCVFWQMGRTGKYSLFDYLDYLDNLGERSNRKHYLADAVIAAGFCLLLIPVTFQIGLFGLIAGIGYNIATYLKEKGEFEPYLTSFSYLFRILKNVESLYRKPIPVLREEQEELKRLQAVFSKMKRGAFWAMGAGAGSTANPLDIVFDYLRMILHIDVIKFNNMLHEVRRHVGDVDRVVTLAGRIEACIAVGEYREHLRKTVGYWCVPSLQAVKGGRKSAGGEQPLAVKGLYHPLLEAPVANSLSAEKGVLLTGSNASGKSTFLKSVAVCALLAQTVHTCPAEEYRAVPFRIYSSMALRDDLESGDSYYIVEIKALKRILDAAALEDEPPVLCFVDEVLRGTNTVERIAASTEILHSLSYEKTKGRVICFAATHDIELTTLLEKEYENFHFEEEVRDGDIYFAYQLLPGKASTRNAIQLLSIMGYEEAIIERAGRRAQAFAESGQWER